jgi:putative ABC transport system permease protein
MSQIRQAFRQLVLRPGLAAAVILMLAVGIGATTAIFSLFYQVLLQPLPVPEPERLVELRVPGPSLLGVGRASLAVGDPQSALSYSAFRELEEKQTSFTALAGHYDFLASITTGTDSYGGNGVVVSGRYFEVLGVTPALGRLIGPQDEPGLHESPVAVLSYDYWQSRFGGDRGVVGRTLTVNDQALTVIGVAAEGFTGAMPGWRPAVFVPLTMRWQMQPDEPRGYELNPLNRFLYAFARLRPGVTVEQATAEIGGLYAGIVAERVLPVVTYLNDAQREQLRTQRMVLASAARGQNGGRVTPESPLTLLLGATALVLLTVCVNITNLLLARGAARAGEMAIRAAIGAGRASLVAQLFIEAAVFGVLGALLALPVALVTLRAIAALVPAGVANRFTPELSVEALGFAAALLVATVLFFGLLPALRASDTDAGHVMKGRSGQPGGGRALARVRGALIGVQVGLSVLLLVLAGLFTRSLANVASVDLGMNVESVVMFSVSPGLNGHTGERRDALHERITEALEAQPGVLAVGQSALPLLGNFAFNGGVDVIGGVDLPNDNTSWVQRHPWISPGFFAALGVPIVAGREFIAADVAAGGEVAVVNQAFLTRFNLGQDIVGTRMRMNMGYGADEVEIVGIAGDAKYASVKADTVAQVYTPRPPRDDAFAAVFFYVRGSVDAAALLRAIPGAVAAVAPTLPVNGLETMEHRVGGNISQDSVMATLSAVFAALATLLAAVGVYAVLSYNIGARTREIGLRLALGSSPGRLRVMVLKQVAAVAVIGAVSGFAAALGVGRLASSQLFELEGYDPLVFGSALAVIALVVVVASYVPARKASHIAPMEALRHE